ncbi:MAG: hypothetical protein Ct9H90mP17_2590 [Actinomycetota bacterium]|nr:MAG: hypothetical protein Ct9H90mP17_2590 [Actinomycetota bacterium]
MEEFYTLIDLINIFSALKNVNKNFKKKMIFLKTNKFVLNLVSKGKDFSE